MVGEIPPVDETMPKEIQSGLGIKLKITRAEERGSCLRRACFCKLSFHI